MEIKLLEENEIESIKEVFEEDSDKILNVENVKSF